MDNSDFTILVVEDHDDSRDMIARRLQREGYRIATAEDGAKGLDIMRQQKIDLVLLDLMMPGMSGMDVLREIKQAPDLDHRTPIIMLTANSDQENVALAVDLGACGYVLKPVNMAKLKTRLHHTLMRRVSA